MRIAMFTDAYWPRVNGVTVSVESFSRELARLGHDVLIVCAEYPETHSLPVMPDIAVLPFLGEKEPAIIRIPSAPVLISREDRSARLDKWFWVRKKLDAFEPDIIHINTEFVVSNFGILYSRTRKVPLVYTFHTLWEDYVSEYIPFLPEKLLRKTVRKISKTICRAPHTIIAPTKIIENVIRRYGVKKHVYLLPTGIDSRVFNTDKSHDAVFIENFYFRFPALKDRKILLYAGRVGQEKNIGFLYNVLEQVITSVPDVVLCIVGDGPWLEYLKEESEKRGLSGSIVFTGYMARQGMPAIYRAASLFVFASKTETQGLVTIEAMLCGLPVVAVGEMGTADVMKGDNGGFMVRDNPEEFSARVVQLLSDKDLYVKKAAEAASYGSRWTIDAVTLKLVTIYNETITFYEKNIKNRKWYQFYRRT